MFGKKQMKITGELTVEKDAIAIFLPTGEILINFTWKDEKAPFHGISDEVIQEAFLSNGYRVQKVTIRY